MIVLVSELLAVGVLEFIGHLLDVGEEDDVFDTAEEGVVVLLDVEVFVLVVDEERVFEDIPVIVKIGEEEEVFELLVVFEDVIDPVTVLVVVELGLISPVGNDDLESVVVFVEVFDCVDVELSKIPPSNKIRLLSKGGVVPIDPTINNNKSHLIVCFLYYI